MNKQNLENQELEAERKLKKRDKKKRKTMKVSGASVKKLQGMVGEKQ